MSLKMAVEVRQLVFPYGRQVGYFHVTLRIIKTTCNLDITKVSSDPIYYLNLCQLVLVNASPSVVQCTT